MITPDELETFTTTAHDLLADYRQKALDQAFLPLVHRFITIQRKLKDPATGQTQLHDLKAVVVDARWSYEDSIELIVRYTHPYTKKEVKTAVSP